MDRSARWRNSLRTNPDELTQLVYAREQFVFHRWYRYWLTPDEARALMREAARAFRVEPIKMTFPRTKAHLGGAFYGEGQLLNTWRIKLNVLRTTQPWKLQAVNNNCQSMTLLFRAPRGMVSAHTFLHEFAHYLCRLWWNHGAHDRLFCAVDEVMHEWYTARRGLKYARAKVMLVKD